MPTVENLRIDVDVGGNFDDKLDSLENKLGTVQRKAQSVDPINLDVTLDGEEYASTALTGLQGIAERLDGGYDIQINPEGIEATVAQLKSIEGITLSEKVMEMDAEGKANVLADVTELEEVSLSDKGLVIETQNTAQTLQKLAEIEGIELTSKDLHIELDGYESLLTRLQSIEAIDLDEKVLQIGSEGYEDVRAEIADLESISVDDEGVTVHSNIAKALTDLQQIDGISLSDKQFDVDIELSGYGAVLSQLAEIEAIEVDDKYLNITSEGYTTIVSELQSLDSISLSDETLSIHTDVEDALTDLESVEGISISNKAFDVEAEGIGASLSEIEAIQSRTLDTKTLGVRVEDVPSALSNLASVESVELTDKEFGIDTHGYEAVLAELSALDSISLSDKHLTVGTEEYAQTISKLAALEEVALTDTGFTIKADTSSAIAAIESIDGLTVDNKEFEAILNNASTVQAQLDRLDGISLDSKQFDVSLRGYEQTLAELRSLEAIELTDDGFEITADPSRALMALQSVDGIELDDKALSVSLNGYDVVLAQLEALDLFELDTETLNVGTEGYAETVAQLESLESISVSDTTISIETDAESALLELRAVEGISLSDKALSVESDIAPAVSALSALESYSLDETTLTANADISNALRDLGLLESYAFTTKNLNVEMDGYAAVLQQLATLNSIDVDSKTLTVGTEGHAEAISKLESLDSISLSDDEITVSVDVESVREELLSIDGISLSEKEIDVRTTVSEAVRELSNLQRTSIGDKRLDLTVGGVSNALAQLEAVEGYEVSDKEFRVRSTVDNPSIDNSQFADRSIGVAAENVSDRKFTVTVNDERAWAKLLSLEEYQLSDKHIDVTTAAEDISLGGDTLEDRSVSIEADSVGDRTLDVSVNDERAWRQLHGLERYEFSDKQIDVGVNSENLQADLTPQQPDNLTVQTETMMPEVADGGADRGGHTTNLMEVYEKRMEIQNKYGSDLGPRMVDKIEPLTNPRPQEIHQSAEGFDIDSIRTRGSTDGPRGRDIDSNWARLTTQLSDAIAEVFELGMPTKEDFLAEGVSRGDVINQDVDAREGFDLTGYEFDDVFDNEAQFRSMLRSRQSVGEFSNRRLSDDVDLRQKRGARSIFQRFTQFAQGLNMSQFYKVIASLVPLLLTFVAALPAAIAGIAGLGAAALGAAAGLGAIAGLGLMGLAAARGGGTDWQSIQEGFKSIKEELRSSFIESFMPVAKQFDDVAADGIEHIKQLFNALAAQGDVLTKLKDDARAFMDFVVAFAPKIVESALLLADALGPLFAQLGEWLMNFDFLGTFAKILRQTIPPLMALLNALITMMPFIIQISVGFLQASAIIATMIATVWQLLGVLGPLRSSIGVVIGLTFGLITVTALLSSIMSFLAGSALKRAIVSLYGFIQAQLLTSTSLGILSASALSAAIAVSVLIGVATLGIGVIGSLAGGFLGASSSITQATAALEGFKSSKSSMGGMNLGMGNGPRSGMPRGSYTKVTNNQDITFNQQKNNSGTARQANKLDYINQSMRGQ